MDLFQSIIEKQALMMEAYKDFRDLCDQLKGDRGQDSQQWSGMNLSSVEPLEMLESSEEESHESGLEEEIEMGGEPSDNLDEFPVLPSFCLNGLDPEDPGFWTGKVIGLPESAVIRIDEGRGKLLPISGGLFSSVYGF